MDSATKRWIEDVYRSDPCQVYTPGYFRRHWEGFRAWERAFAARFAAAYGIESVIDLGCGIGAFLEGFRDAGVTQVKGYEYALASSEQYTDPSIRSRIFSGDVTTFLGENGYDCSWSVEVAEHLPPDGSDTFVQNLCRATDEFIFLTAAPPGQRGTGHINCRPREFWISKVEDRGFTYCEDELPALWTMCKAVEWVPRFFRKNLMLFRRARVADGQGDPESRLA